MALKLDTVKVWREMRDEDTVSRVCLEAVAEMNRACQKFPAFPDKFASCSLGCTANSLSLARAYNDKDGGAIATAESIIDEEYWEFCAAVKTGNRAEARKELVQTIAMLLRTYVHLDHYAEQGAAN